MHSRYRVNRFSSAEKNDQIRKKEKVLIIEL